MTPTKNTLPSKVAEDNIWGSMFTLVTFQDLETRYGNEMALSLLAELEQHVKVNSFRLASYDPEKRMQLVFDIMDSGAAVGAGAAV